MNVLLQLDVLQIAELIKHGLFRKTDYKDPKLRNMTTKDYGKDEFLQLAIDDFKEFIDDSINANEGTALS